MLFVQFIFYLHVRRRKNVYMEHALLTGKVTQIFYPEKKYIYLRSQAISEHSCAKAQNALPCQYFPFYPLFIGLSTATWFCLQLFRTHNRKFITNTETTLFDIKVYPKWVLIVIPANWVRISEAPNFGRFHHHRVHFHMNVHRKWIVANSPPPSVVNG